MLLNKHLILLICALSLCNSVKCFRILGVFPFGAPSHYILGSALMKGLAQAGHNITMISPYQEKNPPQNGSYKDIVLEGFVEQHNKMLKVMNMFETKNTSMSKAFFQFVDLMTELNENVFKNGHVQELLKSDAEFDVVIVEQFLIDPAKIFGTIYNAPVIALSTLGPNPWLSDVVGSPLPLSYIPLLDTGLPPHMTFFERLINTFSYVMSQAFQYFLFLPPQNDVLKRQFSNPPSIYDLLHNVSLVLMNYHESLNQPAPLVPNLIPIGGFHVQPPKKLPKDLQEYLDNAKEGVVYFSLGSNLKSKELPIEKRNAILKAFSKLKEQVLWKWEDDDLPGKPANVKTSKWFPQQDILAHPNVKLFITHSGLLSTTETVYHGVPILAIPVFGDQHNNARLAVQSGYALSLPYEDPSFSEEKLSELLQELLTNPKYAENVKKRSKIFHDRPMKPLDTAVYWVEYVVRTGGAPHLKVAGANLSWFHYHSLDVISFLLVIVSLVAHIIYLCIRRIMDCCATRRDNDRKYKAD